MATPFDRIIAQGGAERDRFFAEQERLRQQQQRFEEQRQATLEREGLARDREVRLDTAQQARDALATTVSEDRIGREQREEEAAFAGGVSRGELAPAPLDLSEIINITNFSGPSPTNPMTGETGFAAKPERVLEADQVRSPRGGVGSVFDVISSQERVEDRFGEDSREADAAFFRKETDAFLPSTPTVNPETTAQASARINQAVFNAEKSRNPFAIKKAREDKALYDTIIGETKTAGRADDPPRRDSVQDVRSLAGGVAAQHARALGFDPTKTLSFDNQNAVSDRAVAEARQLNPGMTSQDESMLIGRMHNALANMDATKSVGGSDLVTNVVKAINNEPTIEGLQSLINEGTLPPDPAVIEALRAKSLALGHPFTEQQILAAIGRPPQ